MYGVHFSLSGETIAYFSKEEMATNFIDEMTILTQNIQMIGGQVLLKPLGEFFSVVPIEVNTKNALDEFKKFEEMKKRADEDFANSDDDDDD